jgi:hypothetical protein
LAQEIAKDIAAMLKAAPIVVAPATVDAVVTVTAPAVPAPAASVTAPVTAPVPTGGQAAATHTKMGLGLNQERFTAVNHDGARSASYYQKYRDLGFKNIRFFIPAGFDSWQIPLSCNASAIAGYLDAVQACVDSGMPVSHIDGTDVIGDWQLDAGAVDNYIRMFAAAVAARNFPADRVVVGAINEYGGTHGNAFWEAHRFRWNGFLRAALPKHTIVEGASCWKDPRSVFDPNFVPWGNEPKQGVFNKWDDPNSMVDGHQYIGWDAAGMDWLCGEFLKWGAANGRPVYMGEYGFDSADGNKGQDVADWITRMDAETQHGNVCMVRPCPWCVTDGDAWRTNEKGGNTMRPGLADAMKRWAERIDMRIAAGG